MTSATDIPILTSLNYYAYLEDEGTVSAEFQGKVGIYAIFDQDKVLQFVGYSRDIYLSLRQHLVRQPQHCYWYKLKTIERPRRTILEEIRDAWIAENGSTPSGNGADEAVWTQPIDAKSRMTPDEQAQYENAVDEITQVKLLKSVARRVGDQIAADLEARGVKEKFRFNPKLKENGLLDLK